MKHLALAAVLATAASPALAQTVCPVTTGACGFTASTTPVVVTLAGIKRYERICNAGTVSLWATRTPGAVAAVNGVGSFPIAAGSCEEYPIAGAPYVPTQPTSVVSASGAANGSVEIN